MKRNCCKQGLVLVVCITWASIAGWRLFPSQCSTVPSYVVINEIAPAWHFTEELGLRSSSSSRPQGLRTYDGAPVVGSGYTASVVNLSCLAPHTQICPLFPPHLSYFSPRPCAFEVKHRCAIRLLLPVGEHCHTVVLGSGISSISITVLMLI